MAVIATKRNLVYAYEPQAGDTHVQTLVRTATERYVLGTQPIENYPDALAWATAIADQLVGPVTLLPITTAEFLNANRAQFENGLAIMTAVERDEMRQVVVTGLLETMRDSDDPARRAEAYEVLKMMKET